MSTVVELQPTGTEIQRLRMSFEEYLARDFEGGLAEWVNGEVIVYMSATELHQRLVVFLVSLLQNYAQLFKLGKVSAGPYSMRTDPDANGREPDVMFISTANLARVKNEFLNGPADLVIEVVSDDSVARDYDTKYIEYQNGGVREYWIVDPRPDRRRADFYVLNVQGRYRAAPVDDEGVYRSTVLPNFWLKLDWLWQEEPNPLSAFTEIVGVEKLMAALQNP